MSDVNFKVKLEGGTFHIISVWHGYTGNVKMHTHSEASYEVHYVESGQGILRLQSGEYPLKKGVFYLTGPGIAHEQIPLQEDPMVELGMYYTAPLPWIETVRRNRGDDKNNISYQDAPWLEQLLLQRFWMGEIPEEIHQTMLLLDREIKGQGPGHQTLIPFLAGAVLVLLGRLYHSEHQAGKAVYVPHSEDARYLQIERIFLENAVEITVKTLAEELSLSVRQLQRLMKSHYGITFQQMQMNYKLDMACRLLLDTKMSIAKIAEKLAFSSPDYFGYCFRRQYGMPPRSFREASGSAGETYLPYGSEEA